MRLALLLLLFALRAMALVDQDGRAFEMSELKGKYVFLSFIYTRCPMPEMCPLTVNMTRDLMSRWRKRKDLPPLHAIAATLDPEYDTPSRLKSYGLTHRVDFTLFTLATGTAKAMNDLAADFNVVGLPSGGMISHNSKSILLSPEGKTLRQYVDNAWKPETVLKDLAEFQAARNNAGSKKAAPAPARRAKSR